MSQVLEYLHVICLAEDEPAISAEGRPIVSLVVSNPNLVPRVGEKVEVDGEKYEVFEVQWVYEKGSVSVFAMKGVPDEEALAIAAGRGWPNDG